MKVKKKTRLKRNCCTVRPCVKTLRGVLKDSTALNDSIYLLVSCFLVPVWLW